MTKGADHITHKLRAKRKALLRAYDPSDLHKLRINIRRARALLKTNGDQRASCLARRLSEIAEQTNAARDWDTFTAYVEQALPGPQWRQVQGLFEARRGQAREQVLCTLRSVRWNAALDDWKCFAGDAVTAPAPGAVSLRAQRNPAKRALKMSKLALSVRDERSWHKLRIAVKNLRYTLDSTPPRKKLRERHAAVAKTCKRLQDDLGIWHDTVVHLTLLDSLDGDGQLAENPGALAALHQLRTSIEARRERALAKVKRTVERDADTLKASVDLFGT